ncbi:MAG: hypothetical protein ACYC7E_02920 [Armatimonadota bacterium]
MKNVLIGIVVLGLVGAGIWYAFSGGDGKNGKSFGQGVEDVLTPIGDIQKAPKEYLGKVVTVEGELTKECPGSGCWWYVKDQTGEIRSDSFGGGFALPLHQEGKHIRTTGKVVKSESGELQIASSGAELH